MSFVVDITPWDEEISHKVLILIALTTWNKIKLCGSAALLVSRSTKDDVLHIAACCTEAFFSFQWHA